jgi:hypothetical protein
MASSVPGTSRPSALAVHLPQTGRPLNLSCEIRLFGVNAFPVRGVRVPVGATACSPDELA